MVVIDVIKIEDDDEDVKPEVNKYPICPKHPNQPAAKVCQDPKCGNSVTTNLVCTLCICSGVHLNHPLIGVEEEYEKQQIRLKDKEKGIEQGKALVMKNMLTLHRAFQNKCNKRKRKMVNEHFQQAKVQLEKLHKAAIEQLDTARDEYSIGLTEKKKEQETSLAELKAKNTEINSLIGMPIPEFFANSSRSIEAMKSNYSVAQLTVPQFHPPSVILSSISTFSTCHKCVYFADSPTFPTTLKNFFASQEKYNGLIKYKGQLLKPLNAETSKGTERGTLIIVLDAQYLRRPVHNKSVGEMARLRRIVSNKRYDQVRIGLVSPLYAVNYIGEIETFVECHAHVKKEYIVKEEPVAKIAFEQFVDNCLA